MNINQAKAVLDLKKNDTKRDLKIKYRKLMARFHPDVIGSDHPVHTKKAQEINEAYKLLKNHRCFWKEREVFAWKGTWNPDADIERNIYMPYSMDLDVDDLYQKVGVGKYMWDPHEEEFHLFLRSLNHASIELLQRRDDVYQMSEDEKFAYQAKLFHKLSMQFVDPLFCLKKLIVPMKKDSKGRDVYCLRAVLETHGRSSVFHRMECLKSGEFLYPSGMRNNQIYIVNEKKEPLGRLEFQDDALYFCLIPLLKEKKAKVKLTVHEVKVQRRRRPYRVKVFIHLYLRIENACTRN